MKYNQKSILFCTGIFPPDIGGPATYVLKMAKKMHGDGIKVGVITYCSQQNNHDSPSHDFEIKRIIRRFFIFDYLKYFFKILKTAKNYEIIYLQGSFSEGIPTILANIFLGKRIVIRIGGLFSWEISTNLKLTTDSPEVFFNKKQYIICEIFKKIDRLVISNCDKVIANSNYIKKMLTINNIAEEKISVIYNSFDNVPKNTKVNISLKKIFNTEDRKILLSHGRFVSWKNFDKIILFFKEISDKYVLIIAGDGPEEKILKKLVIKEGLQESVLLLPKQSAKELHSLNALADIFILLSSYEGLSNALVEAMQLNCKIIASNIEPNNEALSNYQCCRLIDINKNSFLNAVSELENINKCESMNMGNEFDFNSIYKKTIAELCIS
ncbi:MAG: glycosyltransferase family 4 protein [Candidatus Moranbacteria bacterium]|nr:glycosyltransferase family 4 protein [Candidatus Moranbacteria bacterium]